MKLTLFYPLRDDVETSGHLIGYGNVMTNVRQALMDAGVEWVDDAPVALQIAPPHMFRPEPGRYNAVLTMWESRDLPPRMLRSVATADLLIVPSTFCKTVFRRAGFTKPIAVVPLGIHPEDWCDPAPVRHPDGLCKFLWLGSRDERKGWMLMRDAWNAAFTPNDPAVLTVKTSSDPGDTRMRNTTTGQVAFLTQKMPWDELQALYWRHEVYVNTSVGEGFGLIVLEAMAAGCLVISPVHTGLRDFVHPGVAWVCHTHKRSAHYGVSTVLQVPRVHDLAMLMRRAVVDYETTADIRARAVTEARAFSWQRTAEGVIQAIARYARVPA